MTTDVPASGRMAVASQWQLVWWAFKRHQLAMAGLIVTVILYICLLYTSRCV